MKFIHLLFLVIWGYVFPVVQVYSQSVTLLKDFSLGSPFSEPDGRNDVVKINDNEFITLAKVKGNQTGKSDFMLEHYNAELNPLWQVPLSVESFEDFKDLYYNGKELVLLSVVHKEAEKTTTLLAYGYDIKDGKNLWIKTLESYPVEEWETHPSKGKVKESFIDFVCEHSSPDFITPFEYKHTINFSPDQRKFVSYVYNYGEPNLTASVCVYDNSGNPLKKGKVSIDNNYTNHGIYVNNAGVVYILNANNAGKVNLIQFDLDTKDFKLLELPPSNFQKDDFHVQFVEDEILFVGNSEVKDRKIFGVMFSKFNFKTQEVENSIFEEFDAEFKSRLISERKNNKQMKGEEDWLDYDVTHFIVNEKEEVLMVLEKRALHADGYPHIGKDAFDKSHKVEFTGHIQAETIIILSFGKNHELKWKKFFLKNQIYPAGDGLNTVSFILDNRPSELRLLYAFSENLDANLHNINLVNIQKETGEISSTKFLPNEDKLILVRDYGLFSGPDSLIIVGKKGILGKASMIVRYKL